MVSPSLIGTELSTGMRLDLEEFLARWEALPGLKNAELIEGVVYVSSPVSNDHGIHEAILTFWASLYAEDTPGCSVGSNATCKMVRQSPQPDVHLRLTEDFGGNSNLSEGLITGALELVAEICVTSMEIDFGPKLALYQGAGVREYITVETLQPRIVWRVLVDGSYREIQPDGEGILRSQSFPGLWLDTAGFWAWDRGRMHETLNLGLDSSAHREFVEYLKRQSKESERKS